MKLGTAKIDITPPPGTKLAGYSHRQKGAESILDDLALRLFWLENDNQPTLCLVLADVLYFGESIMREIRKDFQRQTGLSPSQILIAGSHTHCGPLISDNEQETAPGDPEMASFVQARILEGALEARKNCREVLMQSGQGSLPGWAVHRRVHENGVVAMKPNPEGVRDDAVNVVCWSDAGSGNLLGVLFHFTCHPNTLGGYEISADYPGVARRYLESLTGNETCAGFLPGCFGDIRPNCTRMDGRAFRRGTPEDMQIFGEALGQEVARIMEHTLHPLMPKLGCRLCEIHPPMKKTSHRHLPVQRLDLAETLSLIAMGGEICCDYGLWIKSLQKNRILLPVGYANGMVGYVPPARYYPSGGYEVERAFVDAGVDSLLREAVLALMDHAEA